MYPQKYVGKVMDIKPIIASPGTRYTFNYEILFQNKDGEYLKYWFYQDELQSSNIAKERDRKIDEILKM